MVLAIVLVAEVMDLIDGTIVNVAAPSIRRDLGGNATTLQWYGAAYTLAFAVLLVTGARLGDRFDRRKVVIATVAAFALVFPLVQGRELGWPAWVFVLSRRSARG